MKHPLRIIIMLAMSLALSACSNRELYNAVQQNRMRDCIEDFPLDQGFCERTFNMSYDEYERERQAVLKEKKKPPQ